MSSNNYTLLKNPYIAKRNRPVFKESLANQKIYDYELIPITLPEKILITVVLSGGLSVWVLALRFLGII